MIYKDTTGIMAIKIFRLYKEKTLTDKQLRKMTKDLLLEYASEKLEDRSKVIEKLNLNKMEKNNLKYKTTNSTNTVLAAVNVD